MTKKSNPLTATTQILISRLISQLMKYQQELLGLDLRGRVLQLLEVHQGVNKLGIALAVEAGLSSSSARERIKEYLLKYKGQVIEADELSAISGILEYGRRVRELRDEGLEIVTGPARNPATGKALRPNQYLLLE
jgi:hypothetical protein